MDGILIIDKPAGITSHDVVSRVRRILKTKRVGHTGTLDPFATGVMVILVGQATRLAQFLDKDLKEYETVVRFGFETETGDVTGMQNSECRMQNKEIAELLKSTDWNAVFDGFRGEIQQTPPMYSAKKIDGKKLYELARKGETVERKGVPVTIHELVLSEPPALAGGLSHKLDTIRLNVRCSAGTYIRTLAEDIGRKLETGAHLIELRRTAAGKFSIDQSVTLEQLEKQGDPSDVLIPMNDAISHLSEFPVPEDRIDKTKNGLSTRVFETAFADGESVRMLDGAGKLIAVGIFNAAENHIQPKVVLV